MRWLPYDSRLDDRLAALVQANPLCPIPASGENDGERMALFGFSEAPTGFLHLPLLGADIIRIKEPSLRRILSRARREYRHGPMFVDAVPP